MSCGQRHTSAPSSRQVLCAHTRGRKEEEPLRGAPVDVATGPRVCQRFGAGEGPVAGLWHDMLYSAEFQEYIRHRQRRCPRGAAPQSRPFDCWSPARRSYAGAQEILGFAIAGHHRAAGLGRRGQPGGPRAVFEERSDIRSCACRAHRRSRGKVPHAPLFSHSLQKSSGVSSGLWVRMLFSTLVDVNFTEAYRPTTVEGSTPLRPA